MAPIQPVLMGPLLMQQEGTGEHEQWRSHPPVLCWRPTASNHPTRRYKIFQYPYKNASAKLKLVSYTSKHADLNFFICLPNFEIAIQQ
jgi:hypothetical protein